MKNLIKISVLLALLVSLFAVLTFSSSAKTPTAGFGVWADEEAYLASPDTPLVISSGQELSTAIGSNKFVLCYGDVTLLGGITVQNGSELIIDLGGHTLTASSSITVGANASYTPTSFTIRNGTVMHKSAQFMKAQPNSRVYFENITLRECASSLFYSDGARLVYFKDSRLIFDSVEKVGTSINIYPLLETYYPKIAALEGKSEDNFTFEHSIVFDNTQLIDNGYEGNILNIPAREDCIPCYSVTFMNGAGFNRLDDTFVTNKNTHDGMYLHLNIIKGAAFSEPSVPIEDTLDSSVNLTYYNNADFDGVRIIPSEITSLAEPDEVQVEGQIPKLIFGASTDSEAPYMLCNYLCDVTWVVNGESIEVKGYADGLTLSNKQQSRGYYFKEVENEKRVYLDVHAGWSLAPDSSEGSEYVTLVDKENTFYAVFKEEGPAVLVEFSSESRDEIISAVMTASLTDSAFDNIREGSYLYLYEDAFLDIGGCIEVKSDFTLDLGTHTLSRFNSVASALNIFEVSGATLTLKNGCINTAFIGIADIDGGAELIADNMEIVFGTIPAFSVKEGRVDLSNSSVKGRSDSDTVPVFLLSENGGNSFAGVVKTDVDVFGPLFSHYSEGNSANINIDLIDSENVKVGSVFEIHPASVGVSSDTSVILTTSGCSVTCDKVFDIPKRDNGMPYVDLTVYLSDGSFSADPRCDSVKLVLDDGKNVVGTGSGYTVAESGFTMKYSMSLEESFTAKFYIPASSDFISVISYLGEFSKESLDVLDIDGEEYCLFEVPGISVADAFDDVSVEIKFASGDNEYIADLSYSPISYLKALLESEDQLTERLAASAIRYIVSAYEYSGSSVPDEVYSILSSEEYLLALRDLSDVVIRHSSTDIGNIREVFDGASLYLSSRLEVRFNVREGYTGKITVAGREYEINDGRIGTLTYVSVTLSACDIYRNRIEITDGALVYGEYSLERYVESISPLDTDVSDLLIALRAFCYEAHVFDLGGVIPPYVEHTPTVDVEHRLGT